MCLGVCVCQAWLPVIQYGGVLRSTVAAALGRIHKRSSVPTHAVGLSRLLPSLPAAVLVLWYCGGPDFIENVTPLAEYLKSVETDDIEGDALQVSCLAMGVMIML